MLSAEGVEGPAQGAILGERDNNNITKGVSTAEGGLDITEAIYYNNSADIHYCMQPYTHKIYQLNINNTVE